MRWLLLLIGLSACVPRALVRTTAGDVTLPVETRRTLAFGEDEAALARLAWVAKVEALEQALAYRDQLDQMPWATTEAVDLEDRVRGRVDEARAAVKLAEARWELAVARMMAGRARVAEAMNRTVARRRWTRAVQRAEVVVADLEQDRPTLSTR